MLALGYFMTGNMAKAIETQEKAIAQLPQDDRAEYEATLAKYRQAAEAESTDQGQAVPTDTDDENSRTPDDPPGAGG